MERINIAELLKDCPKGMELDCTMFNNVVFDHISDDENSYPVFIKIKECDFLIQLDKYGQYMDVDCAKCVIFPKGKTTWEGFQRPFKDGDIIFTHADYDWVSIFKRVNENNCYTYVDLCMYNSDLFTGTSTLCTIEEITTQRLATEEEKQKLFDTIKANGYRWNPETKTLEKLITPKFKVGDRIKYKRGKFRNERTITSYDKSGYWTSMNDLIDIAHQDDWKLVCQYPETYEECCEVFEDNFLNVICLSDDEKDLFYNIIKMKRCRDAYWRLYGEQMGLGKPWEPDFLDDEQLKFCLYNSLNNILSGMVCETNEFLVFPTEEMRDAFYENFKDLIEKCKELL